MKLKKTIIGMTFVFLASTSLTSSFAMQGMSHSATPNTVDGMEMSMTSTGTSIMLKSDIQEGVKAMAHLKDIKEAMAKHGGKQTHHFMVKFSTEGEEKQLDTGVAAVKIVDPEGNKLNPLKMMGMEGSFGVDVELNKKGNYIFEVGTKLNDGKKRLFRFHFDNSDA